jgi:hypothetical protein
MALVSEVKRDKGKVRRENKGKSEKGEVRSENGKIERWDVKIGIVRRAGGRGRGRPSLSD